jgi:beta-galactosidase GanA
MGGSFEQNMGLGSQRCSNVNFFTIYLFFSFSYLNSDFGLSYIFWNEHEPFPGVYDFDGQRDIFRFINLTQQIGLNVLLRVGPYACGEHEYGALPWWLLSNGVDKLRPRTSEGTYMEAVKRWYQVLLPKILPWLYKNGGPVLTVQVLNITLELGKSRKVF